MQHCSAPRWTPDTAVVSLGDTRTFIFRAIEDHDVRWGVIGCVQGYRGEFGMLCYIPGCVVVILSGPHHSVERLWRCYTARRKRPRLAGQGMPHHDYWVWVRSVQPRITALPLLNSPVQHTCRALRWLYAKA